MSVFGKAGRVIGDLIYFIVDGKKVGFPKEMPHPEIEQALLNEKGAKNLNYLHNTSSSKLERVQSMGGMPMPSLAVTRRDIPFEGFGDITLVGNPEKFNPASSSLNDVFSADAYTVRAPSPVRLAKKGAGKAFRDKYGQTFRDLDVYADDTIANIWELENKGDASDYTFSQVSNFFDKNANELFLHEKGIAFDKSDWKDIAEKVKPFKESGELDLWKNEKMDEIFEPEEYFVSNPDRDHYTTRAKLKPYTADELTNYMKRKSGSGQEQTVFGGLGQQRAATTKKLKSNNEIRAHQESLTDRDSMEAIKNQNNEAFFELAGKLKEYYPFDTNSFRYNDEISELISISEKKGMRAALKEFEMSDLPQEMIDEIAAYKDKLRFSPTEYFESKPRRTVELSEFNGAIVPEGTPQSTIDMLKRKGVQVEFYKDASERLALREKFKGSAFSLGGGIMLVGASGEDEAQAALNNMKYQIPSQMQVDLLGIQGKQYDDAQRARDAELGIGQATGFINDAWWREPTHTAGTWLQQNLPTPIGGTWFEGLGDYMTDLAENQEKSAFEKYLSGLFATLDVLP